VTDYTLGVYIIYIQRCMVKQISKLQNNSIQNVCNHTARLLHLSTEICSRRAVKFYIFVSNYCAVVGIHIVKSLSVFYFS